MRYITIIMFFLFFTSHLLEAQSIRKNYTEMNQSERNALVSAYLSLGGSSGTSGAINANATFHNNNFNSIHFATSFNDDVFLAWHRQASHEIETDMQALAEYVTIPYWDWTVNNTANDPLWSQGFLGQFNTPWNLNRSLSGSSLPTSSQVASVQAITNFQNYSTTLENSNVHTGGHIWVGGVMSSGNSPKDPVFYFHHNMVDKLWQDWEEANGTSAYIKTSMPTPTFWSTSRNPNDIVNSRSLGVFYAENQLAVLDQYSVTNNYHTVEPFYYQFTIRAENGFIVPNNKKAKFVSSNKIILKPGFHAEDGSEFLAKIDTDNDFSTPQKKFPTPVDPPVAEVVQNPKKDVYKTRINPDQLPVNVSAYPNPFTSETTFYFDLPEDSKVTIQIIDLNGKNYFNTVENLNKGIIFYPYRPSVDLPPGIYLARVQINDTIKTIRLTHF